MSCEAWFASPAVDVSLQEFDVVLGTVRVPLPLFKRFNPKVTPKVNEKHSFILKELLGHLVTTSAEEQVH